MNTMLRRSMSALAVVVTCTWGAVANAEPMAPAPPVAAEASAPATTTRWCGEATLAIDLTAAGTALLGVGLFYAVSERGDHPLWPLAITAVPAYGALLFGGPIVHWVRGRVGKGFASLALRLFLPVIGSVLDIALLNRETVSEPPPVGLVPIVPIVTADANGFTAGAALAF